MSRLDEIGAALQKADAAGNTADAKMLADAYRAEQARVAQITGPAYNPTEGMSTLQLEAAGVGKGIVDTWHAIQQLAGARSRQQQDVENRHDAALMQNPWGLTGDIYGNILPWAVGGAAAGVAKAPSLLARIPGVARIPAIVRGAATGAGMGAMAPVGTNESRAKNAAIGAGAGAAGSLLGSALGRIVKPIQRAIRPEDKAAVRALESEGVAPTLSQRLGQSTEATPEQARAFTKAALSKIGAASDSATTDVMARAQEAIGNVFNETAAKYPIQYKNLDVQPILDMAATLGDRDQATIQGLVRQIEDRALLHNGVISGDVFQNLKTLVGKLSAQQSPVGFVAGKLYEAMLDALAPSITNPADLAAYNEARTQYRRLLQIIPAIDKGGSGLISPARLIASLGKKLNTGQSIYGRGDQELANLARGGRLLKGTRYDPFSSLKRYATHRLAWGLTSGALGYAHGGRNEGLGAGAAAMLGGPWLARKAAENPAIARYLVEGIGNPQNIPALEPPAAALANAARRRGNQ